MIVLKKRTLTRLDSSNETFAAAQCWGNVDLLNPYSESQFKTLKYQPDFPARFDSMEHAHAFCQKFFAWYNHEHRHSGIGYMTPAAMQTGQATVLYAARQAVLEQAFGKYPERFKHRLPQPLALSTLVGINLPKPTQEQNNADPNFDSKLLQAVSQSS